MQTPTQPPNPSTAPALQPTGRGLTWEQCAGTVSFECAKLSVPLDYHEPASATIVLALMRHRATDMANRIGSIVVNPGGPGASGLDAVRENWTRFTPEVMAKFDIVGFDPRGIGLSSGIHCLSPRPVLSQPYPTNASEVDAFVDYAKQVAAACLASNGDLLAHVGTEDVARDLDRIRAALGDETITYVGTSYGTLIGALYADMFPTHVRAMVLDGPIDPSLDFYGLNAGTAVGSQRQLDEFLAACADDAECAFHSQGRTRAEFDALMGRFAKGPVDGSSSLVAWSAIETELASADPDGLAIALTAARQSNTELMRSVTDWMFDPTLLDPFDAITCADYKAPRTPEGFAQMAADIDRLAPDFGSFITYQSFDCAYWPVESQRVPKPATANGAPPILVVAATGDPLTPYEWGQALADQLESGVLLTRDGDGHTSMEDWCIAQIASSYLLTLATPEPGTTCA